MGAPCAKALTVASRRQTLASHPSDIVVRTYHRCVSELESPPPRPLLDHREDRGSYGGSYRGSWIAAAKPLEPRPCAVLLRGAQDASPAQDSDPHPSCHLQGRCPGLPPWALRGRKPLHPSPCLRTAGMVEGEKYKRSIRNEKLLCPF